MKIQDWFDSREHLRAEFLRSEGLDKAVLSPVGEDCAFRRYMRVKRADGSTLILMESVPDGGAIATPGHKMIDFVRIGAYLRQIGLNAPAVYKVDDKNGYILLEDFGDVSFKAALSQGHDRRALYALATDVLKHLATRARPEDMNLPLYYESHVHTGRRRVVDWYMPCLTGKTNPDGLAEEYLSAWDGIEKNLPPVPKGFLHIDYHFENLMWMPGRKDLQRCGILDFQGAMIGPVPYDPANLLEDARVDVPEDLRREMLARFCEDMDAAGRQSFLSWYRVLATQFHCRVAGQFIRLAVRDGKTRYLQHLPRVAGYIEAGLKDPVLKPLKAWFEKQGIDFKKCPDVSVINPGLFRSDAF